MLHLSINKGFTIGCLLSIFSLTFIASAHRQDFRVTEAFLRADDARMRGPCPLKVVFNGHITVDGPGTVRYTFTRSDGATGPTHEMVFKEAGTQPVSTDWTLGDASALPHYEGWQALKILSPNEMESSYKAGLFSVTCRQPNSIETMVPPPGQQPTPRPTPQPCRLYGERGVSGAGSSGVSGCCTADPSITSVESGFCEGVSPDLPAESPVRRGSETSLAFVPAWTDAGGVHGARLVMGFNGAGPTGYLNWAISTDQGRTWSDRNRSNGGPGGGAVDNPTSLFNSYRGDPSVVALRSPGGVAMVTLADRRCTPGFGAPCPGYPELIVLLVSTDGGETFSKTSVVNDQLGVGTTDQPRVTIDPGDGTVWVMWRARLALTPFLTYVRGGRLDGGSVIWDINGPGQLVTSNTLVDYQHPRFKVFTRPGARAHTIAVSGPQGAPGTSFFTEGRCLPATSGAIRNSFWQYPLGVYFTVSDDDGRNWTDLHSAVSMGQPFGLGCVGGTGGADATGQLIYSENRIDLALDPRNGTYLVTRARAVSNPSNFFVGMRVEVWRRSITRAATFSQAGVIPWDPANPWQFNPSIAARDDGQIAVSYYQTAGASQTVELMVTGSRDGGNTWSAPLRLSRNAPWPATDRSLGEYDEIVALPENVLSPRMQNAPSQFWPGSFYASWSNGVGRVFAAGFTPPVPEP